MLGVVLLGVEMIYEMYNSVEAGKAGRRDNIMSIHMLTHWSYYSLALSHPYVNESRAWHFIAVITVNHWLYRGGTVSRTTHRANTLRPRRNGRYFPVGIFNRIFVNKYVWISIKIWLKFVPKVRINNIPALVQTMAWRRPGEKPLSETKVVSFLTNICVIIHMTEIYVKHVCVIMTHIVCL